MDEKPRRGRDRMKVIVAGKSGDGAIRTVGETLTPVLTRLNILAAPTQLDILSVIMSPDPVTTTFPIGPEEWLSTGDEEYDVLISLEDDSYKPNPAHQKNPLWDIKPNRASIVKFGEKIVEGGCIIYDSSKNEVPVEKLIGNIKERNISVYPIAATRLAKEIGLPEAKNILMVGVLFGLMDSEEGLTLLEEELRKKFQRKGGDIVEKNIAAARRGFSEIKSLLTKEEELPRYKIVPPPPHQRKQYMTVSGNEAFCLGALAAGCRAMVGYPISPATPQLVFMAREMPKYGGICYQASSEIAAIHTVIGFAAAGVRAYTATSGPGLSLMIEAFGHAAALEVPVVVCDCQRKGPDTGAPTKPEQADLNLVMATSHGDVERIILAPSDHEECFWLAIEAFNLAEIYQCPVFVLLDQTIAEGKRLMPIPDMSRVNIDRGKLLTRDNCQEGNKFKRYLITDDGISPRVFLGTPFAIAKMIGTEHTEEGQIIATPEGITKMNDKRRKKMETYLANHFRNPHVFGNPENAEIILVGWGSTKGIILDAASRLFRRSIASSLVHFTHLWPLDAEKVRSYFPQGAPIAVIEENASGQFARILEWILHRDVAKINNYSGRPFEPREIVRRVIGLLGRGGVV